MRVFLDTRQGANGFWSTTGIPLSSLSCSPSLSAPSALSPAQSTYNCVFTRSTKELTSFHHGDAVRFRVEATSGGRVIYVDRLQQTSRIRVFSSTTITGTGLFVSDQVPPYAPSPSAAVSLTSDVVTTSRTLQFEIRQWGDLDAGLAKIYFYIYHTHYVSSGGTIKLEEDVSRLVASSSYTPSLTKCRDNVNDCSATASYARTLPATPGVYSLVVIAEDHAGIQHHANTRAARRLVLYLPGSNLVSSGDFGYSTAAQSYEPGLGLPTQLWYSSARTVTVSWANVFYNSLLNGNDRSYLSPVSSCRPHSVDAAYDQTSAALPLAGRAHHRGVVSFDLKMNGVSVPASAVATTRAVAMQSGKQYALSVSATDVMGNTATRATTLAVDSTPPVVASLTLKKGAQPLTGYLNAEDVPQLVATIEAYDAESGLARLQWALRSGSASGPVLEEGTFGMPKVAGSSACSAACVCNLFGVCYLQHYTLSFASLPDLADLDLAHDADIVFVVTAQNILNMVTVQTTSFKIDLTPPAAVRCSGGEGLGG